VQRPPRLPPEAAFRRPSIHQKSLADAGRVLKHRAESHAGRVREIHLDVTRSGRDVIITWPYHFFSCRCLSHFIYDMRGALSDKTGVRLIEKWRRWPFEWFTWAAVTHCVWTSSPPDTDWFPDIFKGGLLRAAAAWKIATHSFLLAAPPLEFHAEGCAPLGSENKCHTFGLRNTMKNSGLLGRERERSWYFLMARQTVTYWHRDQKFVSFCFEMCTHFE
jgi:hypothetical protein